MTESRPAGRYLVDTSIFVRWFLNQVGYERCLDVRTAFASGVVELETVDFVRFELGHVLRKEGVLKNRLTKEDYLAAVRSVDDVGIPIHLTTADVLESSAELALRHNLRYFDALLIAWSLELGLTVLTTDQKLCNAVAGVARTELLLPDKS